MRATSTATVTAPASHVWDVLSDHEGMSNWGPGISVTLRSEGAPDRNGIGAVRVIDAPGPMPAIVEEVVAFDPGRLLSYKALSGVPLRNYQGEVVLRAVAGGTQITYTVTADQRVPLVEQAVVKAISLALLRALVRRVKATA
jgi:uncharacterized protein YndB with AHSA1/START domain